LQSSLAPNRSNNNENNNSNERDDKTSSDDVVTSSSSVETRVAVETKCDYNIKTTISNNVENETAPKDNGVHEVTLNNVANSSVDAFQSSNAISSWSSTSSVATR
jgi:hypothetical protein